MPLYDYRGERVLAQIRERGLWSELEPLLVGLRRNPRDSSLGVEALKDSYPNAYTVEFDRAMLVYQVLADYPLIEFRQVTWWDDFLGGAPQRPL